MSLMTAHPLCFHTQFHEHRNKTKTSSISLDRPVTLVDH